MKTINIFGGAGQHASNLIDRGIFEDFSTNTIEKNDTLANNNSANAVIVGITETEKLISEIINNKQDNNDLINFSGIMSTTPEHIRNQKGISNFHFLFGPKAKENLKVIFAGDLSETSLKIIDNAKKQSINIIESSIEEHDSKMAITQAMTHLFIFFTGLSDNPSKNELLKEWNTPNNTIADMIFENIFFKKVFEEFIKDVGNSTNISEIFSDIVSKNMSENDIKNFGTPTFLRVTNFISKNDVISNNNILNFIKFIRTNLLGKFATLIAIEELKKNVKL
ncbi:MAG: hypothetical protein Q8K30_03650 [Candidatus Gracilibacteria bacterium]|nr:hypothetical protein [Candidatus Gracilibacteria bacterium]